MSEAPIEPPQRASSGERALFEHLTQHLESERGLLEEYARLAEATDSKALAYVVNLLLEDERQHHRLFTELAESLKREAELAAEDPVVPRMDFHRADRAEVLDVTGRLLAGSGKTPGSSSGSSASSRTTRTPRCGACSWSSCGAIPTSTSPCSASRNERPSTRPSDPV